MPIPDGYTSSAALISYLRRVYPDFKINYRLHEGKQHGVILSEIPDSATLVIIPDAGSSQYEEHAHLSKKGVDVIILDHHPVDEESQHAIVVNNQLSPDYTSKAITGVGIVYKFLEALDNELGVNYAKDYLDLVAIGNIADSAYMGDLEARFYALNGLKGIKNKFIKSMFKKHEFSTKGDKTLTSTSFYINPSINAIIRVGKQEEKDQLFRALMGIEEEVYYKRKDTFVPLEEDTARIAGNVKSRQDKLRDKGVVAIKERIEEKGLLKNKVLIVNVTDLLDKNLGGLVANQLVKLYKRPVLLIRKDEEKPVFTGSARGYEKGHIKDLKQFLRDSGYFNFVEGHPNAFGYSIDADKLVAMNDYINEQLKGVENEDVHEVDFIITDKTSKPDQLIAEIHEHRHLWGGGVDAPLLAFKLKFDKDDIQILGKVNKTTLKFKYKNIEFIMYKQTEDMFNKVFGKDGEYAIEIVGKCNVNEWNGYITPQVMMEDFEVVSVGEKELVF
ncbi:DHH family phosphoesterase [Alkalihalophilus pseudofirmus]|uniref:DHH family phosphoesterase n=1 Tax=Alkalihalophilus pseudofirmus TaxID=79885 RepID=UPI00259B5EAA|nr:DHH family phosphoesterase [Alkalihalophilus pseudofirmus]WEG18637.1 DHH family phosphoesterase [Alkalihalophilus pseudofirmus]